MSLIPNTRNILALWQADDGASYVVVDNIIAWERVQVAEGWASVPITTFLSQPDGYLLPSGHVVIFNTKASFTSLADAEAALKVILDQKESQK